MALFLYALLRHAEVEFGSIRLRLDTPGASRVSRAA
jgi:hypothetical protein